MFVLAYDTRASKDGAPITDVLTPVYVALTTVQTIRQVADGWTELCTHNHLVFYIPRPPGRIADGGMAFGVVP